MDTTFWRRMIGIRLRRRFRPEVTLMIDGLRVQIDVRDGVIGASLYMGRTWEPEIVRLLRSLDLAGGVAVDVGANIGWHTMNLSKCVGRMGRVFAFEPDTHNYSLLESNLKANQMSNVTAERVAIGERVGECTLRLNPWNFGDHRVVTGVHENGIRYQTVRMKTLDSALDSVASGLIRFIKVDVQGYDLHVLEGMSETLKRNPCVILLLEISGALLKNAGACGSEFVDRLRASGFDGFEVHEHRLVPMLSAENYNYMNEHADVNVALSRDPEAIEGILKRIYSATQGFTP